ncbi:hypothetical protein FRC15_010746 [Serendipita sp. 397]|nr:hypothetical protein FRC15_010746 [Serendipita sp. 397]
MITAVGLSLPARLLFTLQEAREDNFGSHPVVWQTLSFIPGSKFVLKAAMIYLQYCGIDNPPRPIIYVNRFAFSRVELENDVIVKTQSSQEVMYGWEVAIEKNDKGEYVFTAPAQGDSDVVRVRNKSGTLEHLTLSTLSNPIPESEPSPIFYWDMVGTDSSVGLRRFSPTLYAYVSPLHQENEVLKGKIEPQLINWKQDLKALPLVSSWTLTFNPTEQKFTLVRAA